MRPTTVIREYDAETGEVIRLHDPEGFGEILSGEVGDIRVFDFVITGVSKISDFTISLTSSDGIEIAPPNVSVTDNIAEEGNFGIENASLVEEKDTLTGFFAGLNMPIPVPMRTDYETNYVYLNMNPGTFEKVGGLIKYGISFKYEALASSSSGSSNSSSESSSSLAALLYYTYYDYTGITKPLYFKRVAEECEDKSLIYENIEESIVVAEYPCDSETWAIFSGASVIGTRSPGVLGQYSNGWIVSE